MVGNVLNYYEILGVNKTSSFKAIKESFRSRAKKIHPDVNSADKHNAEEQMRILLLAYNVLSNPVKRKAYDRELYAFKRVSRFSYRDFLKNQTDDLQSQAKLIFYDLLNGFNDDAVKLYEKLFYSDFYLQDYLPDGDYRDCMFLLAEEFQNRGQYINAFFIFKRLIIEEQKKPYFHFFIEEVIDRLRFLVSAKIQKQKPKHWCILQVNDLLSLHITDRDKAFFCKKIAEIYISLGDKQSAIEYFEKAFRFDKRMGGTKKLMEKMGLKIDSDLGATVLNVRNSHFESWGSIRES
jgi:curved DNA-binding protein CbpA